MKQNTYRKIYRLFFGFLIVITLLNAPHVSQAQSILMADAEVSTQKSTILIITSQQYATDWFIAFDHSFSDKFAELSFSQPNISYENIDADLATDPERSLMFSNFIQQKYNWDNIDLIISIMPSA